MDSIAFRRVDAPRRRWRKAKRHYEVVVGAAKPLVMSLRELDRLLDARRSPGDFWACIEAADVAFGDGDGRMIQWPTGRREDSP